MLPQQHVDSVSMVVVNCLFLVCRRLTPDPEKGFFGVQTPTCIPTTGVTPDSLPNQTYMFNSPNETFSSECSHGCDVCYGLKCDVVYCGSMRCYILAWHAMPSSGPAPQLHCAPHGNQRYALCSLQGAVREWYKCARWVLVHW